VKASQGNGLICLWVQPLSGKSVYRLAMTDNVKLRHVLLTAFVLLFAGAASPLGAQQSSAAAAAPATNSAPTLSVDAKLVNIPVVVHDKKGALVQNLTKDNFILEVDKTPQPIRYFNIDTDLPLTLGLLVDTSYSQRNALDDERVASTAFLDDMLNAPADRDKAFIIQFARETDLLQDTTPSKPKLQAALKQLDTAPNDNSNASVTAPDTNDPNSGTKSGRGHRGGGTTLYDALFLSSDELMSKQKGRKALIILSDGVDNGSKESLSSSIEAAQRADTIVYAIYFKGNEGNNFDRDRQGGGYPGGRGGGYPGGGYPGGYPGGGYPGGGYPGGGGQRRPSNEPSRPDGKKILQRMADETGGELFEVSRKDSLANIYKQIGDELRAQYRLGFSPDEKTASDGYHRIVLTLTKSSPKDLYIQTRDGYYTGSN
jgi:VWFA-related protein